MEKDKETVIRFQLTVPFSKHCNASLSSKLLIEMRSPDSAKCDGINGFDQCGLTIDSTKWDSIQRIVVKHSSNHKYHLTFGAHRRIQLGTRTHNRHKIWGNYILPEIIVCIIWLHDILGDLKFNLLLVLWKSKINIYLVKLLCNLSDMLYIHSNIKTTNLKYQIIHLLSDG